MASKAIARVKVDWSKLSSEVTATDVPKLNRLKAKFDSTTAKISKLPEALPKIDWATYKKHASSPKLVEDIEKSYSAIKLERPKAPAKRLDELEHAYAQDMARYKRFLVISNSYAESAAVVKKKFEDMIPVKEMTYEDWEMTFPHWRVADLEYPSIAPHYERTVGLTREESAAFAQPDPLPYATKQAWIDWETKYKKFYE